jgi:hypothetical protein
MMRAAARDTEIGFSLRNDCRMSHQSSEDGLRRGRHKRVAMNYSDRCRAVRDTGPQRRVAEDAHAAADRGETSALKASRPQRLSQLLRL